MVEEPRLGVLLVLLERDAKRVGNVHGRAGVLPEQDAHYALSRPARDRARVVVCYREQHQRVHHCGPAGRVSVCARAGRGGTGPGTAGRDAPTVVLESADSCGAVSKDAESGVEYAPVLSLWRPWLVGRVGWRGGVEGGLGCSG